MENALDAGARQVRIEIENGGKTRIEVNDDGTGMGREDAILALDRHATSKIRSAADLVGVPTFGFRGEALPAIASVTRLVLHTTDDSEAGTEINVSGGRVESVASRARQRGTSVSVRNLFFNTPARRKFLRSVASETRATHDAIATLALAHPDTGFEFHADGRARLLVPPGQSSSERLVSVWGPDLSGTLVPVQFAAGAFAIKGFAQRPSDAGPTGRRVQLFVNGRPFKDPFLVRAAEAGYRSAIHPGDRPSLFLDIAVQPADVDVNVHPAKLEVRFRDRIGVERVVEEAVRHALRDLVASASAGSWRPLPFSAMPESAPQVGGQGMDFLSTPDTAPFDETGTAVASATIERPVGPVQIEPFTAPLMQLFDAYITYESADAVVIVDQHSAQERILYEAALARLTGPGVPAQRLLLPITFELTDEELEAVELHREFLSRVGFDVEPFGGRGVVVQTVPDPHPRFDAGRCFREMVADLARGRFGGWATPLERFAATYACRAAIKAGERLEEREMRELLLRLFATTLPPHDVHGRATVVQLPREELERRFGRR